MPLVRKCKVCKKEFKTKPYWVKIGGGKYCSKWCHYQGLKTGKTIVCFICKKEAYKSIKNLGRSKSKKYFCSKSCQAIWRNSIVYIGENHPNWRGGESTYKNILLRTKILPICSKCRTKDKRVLAVHHLDRNRKNNKVENLIWLCHNCHHLIHHYPQEK
ncbi:hypothetical protein A3F97_02960 [Candidatus Nomurabacteria bacterium RIFCSPLOWO2_12_FULL_41_10]|uniref:HNH nuclease domain-containing protein n=1 Tax=Candidatus Nomurabacteria bacterium RIFCSPLOWO2_12_FULL_41_10 TaxID=1801795 RepID=A0A1F6YDK2_9BACT|nr:MAG: hypothetical protein A3F97_02960 [Candidatus Nomurabacteria bacterium RIFCSPLOWO2_12_FULL_41_10]